MYVVKQTSVATMGNKVFPGQTLIAYYGKNNHFFGFEGDHAACMGYGKPYFSKWALKKWGYKRKCDAARNWNYKHPENSKSWKSTVEVVEI